MQMHAACWWWSALEDGTVPAGTPLAATGWGGWHRTKEGGAPRARPPASVYWLQMAGGGGAKQARKARGKDAKNKAFKKGCVLA